MFLFGFPCVFWLFGFEVKKTENTWCFLVFWWLPPTMNLEKPKNTKTKKHKENKTKHLLSLNHKVSSKFWFFNFLIFLVFFGFASVLLFCLQHRPFTCSASTSIEFIAQILQKAAAARNFWVQVFKPSLSFKKNAGANAGGGKLGAFHLAKCRQTWSHKCTAQGCRKYVQPHDFHPVFFSGSGQSYTPLKKQSAVTRCALAGAPVTSVPIILDTDHKPVERLFKNLDFTRRQHVLKKEKHIKFGAKHKWSDVEADEVDAGKEVETGQNEARWEQWGGLVQRGDPSTLALFRLSTKTTALRAPGPGPITKRDWKPAAKKFLQGKDVILHTDGAKAYKMKIPGVLHDNVMHKKKKVIVKGKQVWVNPKYTKGWTHQLPTGQKFRVKAGTQIIDRFWGHLRAYLKHAPRKIGSSALAVKVRAAQRTYWHRTQNLWTATGQMLKELRAWSKSAEIHRSQAERALCFRFWYLLRVREKRLSFLRFGVDEELPACSSVYDLL